MESTKLNKLKVFNDPVHGFIAVPNEFIFDIIEHPYFQRLRNISQTGMLQMVYPGARHSRFHHALGCLHLMQKAVEVLKMKGINISSEEENATYCAILLHDIGHGPFSHSLESSIIEGAHHENISLRLMEKLNQEFEGRLTLAIQIFKGEYKKKYLTQLVSSQLDVDRLDYLTRDSFFTGVVEGSVNPQRIISMMNVYDNNLVIDAKAIYSIESFLIARMFMYWQVYFHKTSFSSELYLIQALRRAKELVKEGEVLFATEAFNYFLHSKSTNESFSEEDLYQFTQLDDSDVMSSLKEWSKHKDKILSYLAKSLINRKLPNSVIQKEPLTLEQISEAKARATKILGVEDASYFVRQTKLSVIPYDVSQHPIIILYKDETTKDIIETEQQILSNKLTKETIKYHIQFI